MVSGSNISAVVITRNEERNIARCLKSLSMVTPDIIVVDSGSTDRTIEIAEQYTAKVIRTDWAGYGESRNAGAAEAANEYILAIDADEELSVELISTLKTFVPEPNKVYALDRLNNYGGKWIKHGTWYPDWKIRLYPKESVRWDNNPVHEDLIIPLGYQKVRLEGKLYHYTAPDTRVYKLKMDRYAHLGAESYLQKGKSQSKLAALFKAGYRFVKSYIFRLGFLDGKAGLDVSLIEARTVMKRQKYLKEAKSTD